MSFNFKKEGQKLPLFGVRPYLVWGIGLITVIGIILTYSAFKTGCIYGIGEEIFHVVGGILILIGVTTWYIGALCSGMDENITENRLKRERE